jgi:dynactin 1
MSGSLSLKSRPGLQKSIRSPEPAQDVESTKSSTIEEEGQEDEGQSIDTRIQERDQNETKKEDSSQIDVSSPELSRKRTTSISRTTTASVESRTADKREVEQLKAKIRTLEKKAMENRDRMKTVDALQSDKDRYETIIQTLQKKLKANQQEMSELKVKYDDAENRAGENQGRSAEHESEIELATLDKEMAEERAEMYHAELEALKIKHEELELELDVIREENRELGSVMSPEEKAHAGWMQMEKEQERLRRALILLRDMSQTNEIDLKS